MILKLTGRDVAPGVFKQGVLTATDSSLFPTVHATAISLKQQRVAYAVVDHGLTDNQIEILHSLDVMVYADDSPLRPNASLCETYPNIPPEVWRKPDLCVRSPFKMTAWIDADAIPLAHSHELFQWPQGFITLDHFVDQAWADENYSGLVEALGGSEIIRLNSGVFTFPQNANWINKWRITCTSVLHDRRLAALAHCRDQSALVATLSLMQPRERPTMLTQPHWNYPADGFRNMQAEQRMRDYPTDGQGLLDFARERHPGVSVVHWMGHIKPWMLR